MWMPTEGSVHKLQDCRDGSSPIGSGTAHAFFVVSHLHCLCRGVEKVAAAATAADCVFVSRQKIFWKYVLEPVCTPFDCSQANGWGKTGLKKKKNDAGKHKLNWVVHFLVSIGSYGSKIYKFDGKRLFSEAGAGFQSCWELIAQPVKPRYAKDGIKNVINIRAHFVLCRRMR